MLYEITVPKVLGSGREIMMKIEITSSHWMSALADALDELGEDPAMISNVSCRVVSEELVEVTSNETGRVFTIVQITDAPGSGSSKEPESVATAVRNREKLTPSRENIKTKELRDTTAGTQKAAETARKRALSEEELTELETVDSSRVNEPAKEFKKEQSKPQENAFSRDNDRTVVDEPTLAAAREQSPQQEEPQTTSNEIKRVRVGSGSPGLETSDTIDVGQEAREAKKKKDHTVRGLRTIPMEESEKESEPVQKATSAPSSREHIKIDSQGRPERKELSDAELLEEIYFDMLGIGEETQDLHEMYTLLLELIHHRIPCETASVLISDEFGVELTYEASQGAHSSRLLNQKVNAEQGFTGCCLQEGVPILSNTPKDDERWSSELEEEFGGDIESICCAPIIHGARVFGVIELINGDRGFRFHELGAIKLLGAHLGEHMFGKVMCKDLAR